MSASDFIAPADCWGDVSAASAPLGLDAVNDRGPEGVRERHVRVPVGQLRRRRAGRCAARNSCRAEGRVDARHGQGKRRPRTRWFTRAATACRSRRFQTCARHRRPAGPCRFRTPTFRSQSRLAKGTTTVKADGGMMIANQGFRVLAVERRQRRRRRWSQVVDVHEGDRRGSCTPST